MGKTAIFYHPDFLLHNAGQDHPERPDRLLAIVDRLKQEPFAGKLEWVEPGSAFPTWITTVHAETYRAQIEALSRAGDFRLDPDTAGGPDTYRAAMRAAGAVLTAVDRVMKKENPTAFCLVRPPGHHALPDRGMGFCIFNNVAIGVRYLQEKYGLKRVTIIDWDAHHGNGTQAIFYRDPTVFYCSLHQYPFYPGTGKTDEVGAGPGKGFTVNCTLPAGSGDQEFLAAFNDIFLPRLKDFAPEFIFLSAGFDAHRADPLTGLQVTEAGFREASRLVRALAQECCQGRLVSVLEGGYNLAALARSVAVHIEALLDEEHA